MLGHVGAHAVGVAEETQVAKLVELVRSDRLLAQDACWYQARFSAELPKKLTPAPAKVILDVDAKTKRHGWGVRLRRPGRGCRSEGAKSSDERMHGVRVVPEQAEVRRGRRHRRQRADNLFGVDRTGGVGVVRNHPHALDLRILRRPGRAISPTSGPSWFIGTAIISMPRHSVIAK